ERWRRGDGRGAGGEGVRQPGPGRHQGGAGGDENRRQGRRPRVRAAGRRERVDGDEHDPVEVHRAGPGRDPVHVHGVRHGMSETTSYRCPYCRNESTGVTTSCPTCGAPVDVRLRTTASGWTELPPVTDMAKIQLGHSSCQIAGKYVPVAEVNLSAGDTVY